MHICTYRSLSSPIESCNTVSPVIVIPDGGVAVNYTFHTPPLPCKWCRNSMLISVIISTHKPGKYLNCQLTLPAQQTPHSWTFLTYLTYTSFHALNAVGTQIQPIKSTAFPSAYNIFINHFPLLTIVFMSTF